MLDSAQARLLSQTVTAEADEHALQQSALIKCLLVTAQHFFGGHYRGSSDCSRP
jgi:hypothetical protein